MVATAGGMRLEVRPVGINDFDAVYPLLQLFGNPKMRRSDWRTMLFDYAWWDGRDRGFALYDHGVPVGFLGTIYSRRRIDGQDFVFCNASSWIVREEYRTASLLLLKPLLAQRDCSILNLTPTPRSYAVFEKFGFKQLESEQLILLPWGSPGTALGGSFSMQPGFVRAMLSADERQIYDALGTVDGVRHIMLRAGGRACYVVATVLRVKRLPLAQVHFIGDRTFFWQHRALLHRACLQTMGAVGIAVDRRFAEGWLVAAALRRPAMRLYRPASLPPPLHAIDTLFSELMSVKI